MNTPVINLILVPGEPGCRVTVTSPHDQVAQQFGDPQAALEAALLAGAAICLTEEGLEHRRDRDRQIVPDSAHERAAKTSPTGSSYLDEARGEGQNDGWAGPVGPPVSIPDLSDNGETLPDEEVEEGFVTPPGPDQKAPDGNGGEPGPEYRFEAARQAAASALRLWDNTSPNSLEPLQSIKTLLQAAVDNTRAAAILLPLDREPWRETELSKMHRIGTLLREKWYELVTAGEVQHHPDAYKLTCEIGGFLDSEVFSLAGQQETAPACAEASPPAGLPA